MKQVLQDLAKGTTYVTEAPMPQVTPGSVLINTTTTLISVGTERMLVDFGKASLVDKARQEPDKVKMVLEKIKTDGLMATIDAVRSKLEQPLPLGYCNVGVVDEVGRGVTGLRPGDRVVSNGPHAEVVRVPRNLCAKIPDNVDGESAVFAVMASIGLQGIRLAQPTLGEVFVVTGVGLIGLLTVQLLRAHGCRVLAIDFDEQKLDLARAFGAEVCSIEREEDPVSLGMAFSRGEGVDGVIIAASTKSNAPISQAARMCRRRGRIVLVGVTGLELSREDFYKKELSFQVSCSYGPGRYDPNYEEKGQDYPYGLVRWTEQRNFEAVLDMMASGQLNVKPLITHRFAFENAPSAYQVLTEDTSALGILLQYTSDGNQRSIKHVALRPPSSFDARRPVIGFIGAGNYASRVLIPAFKAAKAQLHTIVSAGGIHGVIHGERAGFAEASSDVKALLDQQEINTVAIVTRHDTHARLAVRALQAGKHVFLEKPLALTDAELTDIDSVYRAGLAENRGRLLMVGFNRRFAPQVREMKRLLDAVAVPKAFVMTVNAGEIPREHWTQDPEVGGGRVIGEACHFVDLLRFLAGSAITGMQVTALGNGSGVAVRSDKISFTLNFADGSIGTVHYLANGHRSFPKERLEVFCAGRILQLDNFRRLRGWGWPRIRGGRLWRQDKGQQACVNAFLEAVRSGGQAPIPYEELQEVSRWTLRIANEASR